MTVVREEYVAYAAVCDRCGERGPAQPDKQNALEAVTAESYVRNGGSWVSLRWRHVEGRLYCAACAHAARVATRDR